MTARPTMAARDADGDVLVLHPLAVDQVDSLPRVGACPCGRAFMLAFPDLDGERVRELPVLLHAAPPCEVFRTVDDFPRLWTYLNTGQLPREAAPLPAVAAPAPVKPPAKRHHR